MSYTEMFGIYPNTIDKVLGLVESACDEYDIDFDMLVDELGEDVADALSVNVTRAISMLALDKLTSKLDGHDVSICYNGWDTYVIIDGQEIYL